MLCASNKEYVDYAKFLSTQAKDKSEYYEHVRWVTTIDQVISALR